MDGKKSDERLQKLHNFSALSSSSTACSSFLYQIPINNINNNNNIMVFPSSQLEEAAPPRTNTTPTTNNMSHPISFNNHSTFHDGGWIADLDRQQGIITSRSSKVHGSSNSNSHASSNKKMKEPQTSNFEQDKPYTQVEAREGKKKRTKEPTHTIETETQLENIDDGYRWRKYGQKNVRNCQFPRSYYRCSASNCGVRKKVMRSTENDSMVITSYVGEHNHEPPKGSRPISYKYMSDVAGTDSNGLLPLPHLDNPLVNDQLDHLISVQQQQQQPSFFNNNNNNNNGSSSGSALPTFPISEYVMNYSAVNFNAAGGGFVDSVTIINYNNPSPPVMNLPSSPPPPPPPSFSDVNVLERQQNYVMNLTSPTPPPLPSFNDVVGHQENEENGGDLAPPLLLDDIFTPSVNANNNTNYEPLWYVGGFNFGEEHNVEDIHLGGGLLPPLPPANDVFYPPPLLFGDGFGQGQEQGEFGGGILAPLPAAADDISIPAALSVDHTNFGGGFVPQERGGDYLGKGFGTSSVNLMDDEGMVGNTGLLEDIVMSAKLMRREEKKN